MHGWRLPFYLGFTVLFGAAPTPALHGAANGSFEEVEEVSQVDTAGKETGAKVTTAKGWTALIGARQEVITGEGAKDGKSFLRVRDASATEPVAVESVKVPAAAGAEFTAQAWVRSPDAGDPALYLNFYDAKGRKLESRWSQAAQSGPYADWAELRVKATAPKETVATSLVLYSYTKDTGTYEFDAVSLAQTAAATAPAVKPATKEPAPAREATAEPATQTGGTAIKPLEEQSQFRGPIPGGEEEESKPNRPSYLPGPQPAKE